MERPEELGHLESAAWSKVNDLADRFEQAWRQASGPTATVNLHDFLPGPEDPLRLATLHELILLDLEFRWRRGQRATLEQYLEQFPELGSSRTLDPSLLYEEYRVRQLYGDHPQFTIYQHRFPDQFPKFQELIQERSLQNLLSPGGALSPASAGQPPRSGPSPTTASSPPPAPGSRGNRSRLAPTPQIDTASAPPSAIPSAVPSAMALSLHEGVQLSKGHLILRRIGSGGFGEVWQAEAPGGVQVAIKILFRSKDDAEAQRELRSLELSKNLRHPFLMQTSMFWYEGDRLLIAMELAEGNLRDRLKECRRTGTPGIPLDELLRYFQEAGEALDFLHIKGVLHRDVKPDNILLLGGHAKVADFGLARALDGTQRSMTASGSGTPPYMAPEVWQGRTSKYSDQYALACAYAELRLEKRLFSTKENLYALMMEHFERTPELDPMPAAEQEVVLRGLAKDPNQRFESCKEFADTLVEAVRHDAWRMGGAEGTDPDSILVIPPSKRDSKGSLFRPRVSPSPTPFQCPPSNRPQTRRMLDTVGLVEISPIVPEPLLNTQPTVSPHAETDHTGSQRAEAQTLARPHPSRPAIEPVPTPAGSAVRTARADWRAEAAAAPQSRAKGKKLLLIVAAGVVALGGGAGIVAFRTPSGPEPEVAESTKKDQHTAAPIARVEKQPVDKSAADTEKRLVVSAGPKLETIQSTIPQKTFGSVLAELALSRRSRDFKQGRLVLAKASNPSPLDDEGRLQLDLEKALLFAQDPESSRSEREDALKAIEQVLVKESLPKAVDGVEISRTLAELAESPLYLEQVRRTLDGALGKLPPPAASFAYYVRARKHEAGEHWAEAARTLLEGFPPGDGLPEALKEAPRRDRAVQILLKAAQQLRAKDTPIVAFAQKEEADQAYRWLERARLLLEQAKQPTPPALQVQLALAAWSKPQPIGEQARQLVAGLLKEPRPKELPREDLCLLLQVHAQAEARANDPAAALRSYGELFELLRNDNDLPVLQLYQSTLEPALRLTDPKADAGTKQVLARLHAAKGQLLRDSPALRKQVANSGKVAVQAYDDAIRLHASRDETLAGYYIGRAWARPLVPGSDPQAQLQDAQEAIQVAPNYPGAHALLGHASLVAALQLPLDQRLEKLRHTVKVYEKAVTLYQSRPAQDEAFPQALTEMSVAYLRLANDEPGERGTKIENLRQAVKHAETATQIRNRGYPEYAWSALGNAYEDLAWLVQEDEGKNYEAAVAALLEAKTIRPTLAKGWLDLGRCQYKSIAYRRQEAKALEEAVQNLRTAVTIEPDSSDAAQASYWLAMAHWYRSEAAAADQAFQSAIQLADRHKLSSWSVFALDRAKLALDQARQARQEPTKAAVFTKSCRTQAEGILQRLPKHVEAAYILGKAFEEERDPKSALAAYDQGLPDVAKTDRAHINLLLARVDCLCKWDKQLKTQYLAVASLADKARELAAPDGQLNSYTKAHAFGNAGLVRHLAIANGQVDPKDLAATRKTALDYLLKAAELLPQNQKLPIHPDGWQWRTSLAFQYHMLFNAEKDAERRESHRTTGLKWAREARKHAPGDYPAQLDDFIKRWEAE